MASLLDVIHWGSSLQGTMEKHAVDIPRHLADASSQDYELYCCRIQELPWGLWARDHAKEIKALQGGGANKASAFQRQVLDTAALLEGVPLISKRYEPYHHTLVGLKNWEATWKYGVWENATGELLNSLEAGAKMMEFKKQTLLNGGFWASFEKDPPLRAMGKLLSIPSIGLFSAIHPNDIGLIFHKIIRSDTPHLLEAFTGVYGPQISRLPFSEEALKKAYVNRLGDTKWRQISNYLNDKWVPTESDIRADLLDEAIHTRRKGEYRWFWDGNQIAGNRGAAGRVGLIQVMSKGSRQELAKVDNYEPTAQKMNRIRVEKLVIPTRRRKEADNHPTLF